MDIHTNFTISLVSDKKIFKNVVPRREPGNKKGQYSNLPLDRQGLGKQKNLFVVNVCGMTIKLHEENIRLYKKFMQFKRVLTNHKGR